MTMIVKDPDSRIDFEFDWAAAYPGGQAVLASVWAIVPAEADGVAVAAAAHDLMQSTATLTGGVAGHVYRVTNRVTLSDGQIDERSMTVRVEDR
ncbi:MULTISPECIES: hypothetical protein [unclassified Sphingopyxis]|uniref:phage fiber-tail adaptor protein n=1 Tax=unclassified Sphingopyxis TaxID=2614943 RepID=UPI0028574567|nr:MULTISPECIES: hypothetical protein [unclassified Sphingopyxis]MDR6834279.1 hypothetical protein [Sphingopyxis sp. BE122]MDR7226548.1 hypothetical protein [Sphingopyxis sp. BE259]